jgi:hypothetical protein
LLCGYAAVRDETQGDGVGWTWRILVGIGVVVGLGGVYWAYNL